MIPRRSDNLAEGVIVALVVIVLGVAAARTKLEPADDVDRLAAKVRMIPPIAHACLPREPGEPESTRSCIASAQVMDGR